MRTYKRTTFNLLKSILAAPAAGIGIYAVALFFFDGAIRAVCAIAAAAALLYMAIYSEDVYFELDDHGSFKYYKRKKLKQGFDLTRCQIGYNMKTESGVFGSQDIRLQILDDTGAETIIDASPVGGTQFTEMFEAMQKHSIKTEKPLTASKPEE